MPHNGNGRHGAVAGANEGRRRLLPQVPKLNFEKPKVPFPQAGREHPMSPRERDRENRKSMRQERKRPAESSF